MTLSKGNSSTSFSWLRPYLLFPSPSPQPRSQYALASARESPLAAASAAGRAACARTDAWSSCSSWSWTTRQLLGPAVE